MEDFTVCIFRLYLVFFFLCQYNFYQMRREQELEKLIAIYNTEDAIPAVFSFSQKHEKMPAVSLCH